ncbi:MAG: effector-associated domain EAD1-containing protein [Caldilineaceae bacterium]
MQIFLSVGRTFTDQQEAFVSDLEKFLKAQGLTPLTVGRSYFSSQQPLKAIDNVMRECSGTMIVAFERLHIQQGFEKRGSPNQSPLDKVNLPTVWNQIEAAMAYTLGHPLLVMVQNSVRSEGLLEQGYDWYVQSVELQSRILWEPEFTGVFGDWKKRVESFNEAQKSQTTRSQIPISHSPAEKKTYQLEQFYNIMLQAYASEASLERLMLFGMNEHLKTVAGGASLGELIFNLVAWADRVDRFDELVKAAHQYNPGNQALESFVQSL